MAFSFHHTLSGVHVPHLKRTASSSAVRMTIPEGMTVTLPTSMHIGKPAKPVVKVGDAVSVGTLVAEQDGAISSPVYASVSGKVTKISDMLLSNGSRAPAVSICSDGLMTPDPQVKPLSLSSREDLIDIIRMSGLVGLGGAGFPTYVKYNVNPDSVDTLIINGAECEPYITSDSLTMVDHMDDIAFAVRLIAQYLSLRQVIIGIEDNKPEAIAAMKQLSERNRVVRVQVLPSVYPQGGEKVLVYHTTGRIIPVGKLPLDVGCIVSNCTTVASIGHVIRTGMPLVEKCVTVDGGAVKQRMNVVVPIGTHFSDLFDFCGGLTEPPAKVLYGGPMMGIAVPDLSAPVLKNTNAVLALTKEEARTPKTTACIRCGSCTNACPFGINPAAIARAWQKRDTVELDRLGTDLCMECGCCSFVCPANRPLVQTNRLAKGLLREERNRVREEARAAQEKKEGQA